MDGGLPTDSTKHITDLYCSSSYIIRAVESVIAFAALHRGAGRRTQPDRMITTTGPGEGARDVAGGLAALLI